LMQKYYFLRHDKRMQGKRIKNIIDYFLRKAIRVEGTKKNIGHDLNRMNYIFLQ
jgi:hypothetical protein